MPEMNGQEFAIEMRRLRPQAPIIQISGSVDIPEQALKSVDALLAQDPIGQPFVDRDCAVAGMLTL